MRYSLVSKGLSPAEIEGECRRIGARQVKLMPAMKQVFCELDETQAERLSRVEGLKLKPVKSVAAKQVVPAQLDELVGALNLYDIFNDLRQSYSPPLDGAGLTVAIADSGIRTSHQALVDKVVYSANFSDSETSNDIFGHGTGVAFLIAGAYSQRSGVAPGAHIMNIKVLNDDGVGTDEMLVEGIDRVCQLVEEAVAEGLAMTDPMYPNTVNISLGSNDDGDPDNPIRVACRTAVEDYGLQVIAAAGNDGPELSSIMCPACEPLVIAVGGIKTGEFTVWEESSRGPTQEGEIKPDLVCWAESIQVAGNEGDDEYILKSGTSFAAPIITGLDGLLWDLARRVYGEQARVTYYDWLPYAYAYCVKPEGIQIAKDNTYGCGMPAVGSMVSQLMKTTSSASTLMQALPMLMMVGIMPAMMK